VPEFNEMKFRELLVYVAGKCANAPLFGATKLNKILFYADFLAYEAFGEAITGAEYIALEFGPAPKRYLSIQREMEQDRSLVLSPAQFNQKRLIALREADLSQFSAGEISLVDTVIESLRDETAKSVSDMSHAFLGWQAARAEYNITGQVAAIPYDSVFLAKPDLDEFEQAHGLELAGRYGWSVV
jgi:hypothetical protein